MGDLKPCSRCECKDIPPQIELIRGTWIAWCEGCHTSTASKDRDECIKDWNTRPIEERLATDNARLRETLKRLVKACYLADMQFDCDCCMDGDDPIHMDDCVVPALCRAVAENADIVARIEEERGKETR